MASSPDRSSSTWPFEDAMVICIDIECLCDRPKKGRKKGVPKRICEIGISAFDPYAIPISAAGDRAINTWRHIGGHVIAIKQNKHRFRKGHADWCVIGHPNAFAFGQVEWIATEGKARDSFTRHIRMLIGDSIDPASMADPSYVNQRKITFLFYSASQDRKWLKDLDINLAREFPNMEIIDSQQEFPAWHICRRLHKGAPGHQLKAEKLYDHLGFPKGKGMHNGGNDAVWELRAYLASLTLSQIQKDHIWHVDCLGPLLRTRTSDLPSWKYAREHNATTSTFGFRWLVNVAGMASALLCEDEIPSTDLLLSHD